MYHTSREFIKIVTGMRNYYCVGPLASQILLRRIHKGLLCCLHVVLWGLEHLAAFIGYVKWTFCPKWPCLAQSLHLPGQRFKHHPTSYLCKAVMQVCGMTGL